MQLGRLPRVKLAHLPTPLEEAPRLSEYLKGPRLWIKRDDLTGLAMGGNKARKLELLLGEARAQGADVVITVGAVQSNHCRMTAAAAKRLGLEVVVVLDGEDAEVRQGNLLLDSLFGAEIRIVDTNDDYLLMGVVDDLARQLRRDGRQPYVIPLGGSNALGAAAYLEASLEMLAQANTLGVRIDGIIHASSSGGTQAGLYTGTKMTESGLQVIGISAGPTRDALTKRVLGIVSELTSLLELRWRPHPDDLLVWDTYVGERYGIPTPAALDAIKLTARTEGILLDPVYTGKAMAGLIDLIRTGYFRPKQNVVFWHTGGQPALFAHASALQS